MATRTETVHRHRVVVMNPDPPMDEFVEAVIDLEDAGFEGIREIHDEAGSALVGHRTDTLTVIEAEEEEVDESR